MMPRIKKTVSPSIPTIVTEEVKKEIIKFSIDSLQKYLESCEAKRDTFTFDDAKSAYEFGKNLRDLAMKEEGVAFAEHMVKFDVEINYTIVRLRLLGD
jgi:hypothetical protein